MSPLGVDGEGADGTWEVRRLGPGRRMGERGDDTTVTGRIKGTGQATGWVAGGDWDSDTDGEADGPRACETGRNRGHGLREVSWTGRWGHRA